MREKDNLWFNMWGTNKEITGWWFVVGGKLPKERPILVCHSPNRETSAEYDMF